LPHGTKTECPIRPFRHFSFCAHGRDQEKDGRDEP